MSEGGFFKNRHGNRSDAREDDNIIIFFTGPYMVKN